MLDAVGLGKYLRNNSTSITNALPLGMRSLLNLGFAKYAGDKITNKITSSKREKVFISYSHADKYWLNLLKRHFKALESKVDFWDDSRIKPGQKWKDEIELALSEARIGILLLSADFFNSDFIINNELPPLLELAKKDGATILSVILKPCMFEEYPQISCYQAINSPSNSVIQMDEGKRELTFVELIKRVKEIVENK